jgi:predicted nucleic acid-binding protein
VIAAPATIITTIGSEHDERSECLAGFSEAGMRAIEITEQVARVHTVLWAPLAAKGQLIGAHDLWIAATALAHGMGLATGNADEFRRVPGLRVITTPA